MTTPVTTPPASGGKPGYLRGLKTLAVEAVQNAFQVTYPIADPSGGAQSVYCSLDYPVAATAYPGIWVTYAPAQLQSAGINYTETDAGGNTYVRWRFSGTVTFTVAALSNNERDLLYDQLVSVIGYSSQSTAPGPFRDYVESSPLIESTWSYDSLDSEGHGETLGTPWGTDEVIYEDGISIQVTGEFTADPVTGLLVPPSVLREIDVTGQPVVPGLTPQPPAWEQRILARSLPGS